MHSEATGLIIFCVLVIFIAGCSGGEGATEYDADGFDAEGDSCDIELVYEDSIEELMETHCVFCHSAEKEGAQRLSAPPGIDFDSEALIQRHIDKIRQTVIVDQTMPPGAPLEACQLDALSTYLNDLEGCPRQLNRSRLDLWRWGFRTGEISYFCQTISITHVISPVS